MEQEQLEYRQQKAYRREFQFKPHNCRNDLAVRGFGEFGYTEHLSP